MSAWPDGFDVAVREQQGGWYALVNDRRPGISGIHLPGYTTRQEAELAALDWIQRRVGKPATVPQPVLPNYHSHKFALQCIENVLERLWSLEHMIDKPDQANYTSDAEHTAAAECWLYRCGLIGALRNSLQAERDLIREKL